MLILPERNAPRGKLLLPQRRLEWDQPSQRRYIYGIPNQTRFRITARLHDGAVYWCGWFDDREDADAFFFAAFAGSLHYERELWRLPKPCWHPEFADLDLVYDLATVTFLTSPTGSNQTWTSPSDWNNGNNSIEGIGGGGNPRTANNTSNTHATGGGGGQYAKITNFVVATPGTTTATYQIGANAGGVTWFNSTVDPGAGADNTKLGAKGGTAGNNASGNQAGGPGGTGGWGTTLNTGGRGGNLSGASGVGTSGGGGAAGPNGAGNNGVDSALTSTVATAGGSGDAGSGGAGGAGNSSGNATAGGNGTEWDASHGAGGAGGGAVAGSGNTSAGAGGLYGAGGSSCIVTSTSGTPTGGTAQPGIIVVTYTPGSGLNKAPLRYIPRRR